MDSYVSPPRSRSNLPAVDIGGFFDAVNLALALHLQTERWPTGTEPTLVHDFPRERIGRPDDKFDVITFHVGGSTMAPTSNDGTRIPRAPQFRDRTKSQQLYGYNDVTMAWKEIAHVVFTIWSKSNKRADDLANWFHRFLMRYAYGYQFFRNRGVDLFEFVSRHEDRVDTVESQEIYQRFLEYKFRIEYVTHLQEKLLQSIQLNVGIQQPTDTIERP